MTGYSTAPEQEARRMLERCTGQRGYWGRSEAFDPERARRDRKYAAEKGWASQYDDPNLTVRASVLEALCSVVLGVSALPVDDWSPADWEAFDQAVGR